MRPAWASALGVFLAGVASAAPLRVPPRLAAVLDGRLSARLVGQRHDGLVPVWVAVPGGARTLERRGWQVFDGGGDRARVLVDEAGLAALVKEIDLSRIELAPRFKKTLDRSVPSLRVPEVRTLYGLDGRGVLVGEVDTGADLFHPDFQTSDGKTRFALYADMTNGTDNRHPELNHYGGRIWLRDEIDDALVDDRAGFDVTITGPDIDGHGTHVLSTAAGNGLATGNLYPAGRYVGVAPGATLVAAQALSNEGYFDDAAILGGAAVLVDYAAHVQMPIVVNMSLGGAGSPRDGSSMFDESLDAIFDPQRPGTALVVAVGNEGYLDQHAAAWNLKGENELQLELGQSDDTQGYLAIEFYYRNDSAIAADTAALEIELVSPTGIHYGPAAYGQIVDNGTMQLPEVGIDNGSSQPPREGDGLVGGLLYVYANDGPAVEAGIWRMIVRGEARRFDAWIIIEPDGAESHFMNRVSRDMLLGSPATAKNTITVGAHTTRLDWLSFDGVPVSDGETPLGNVTPWSSSGPTYDGRFAPDVTAPGEFIIAAMSTRTDYTDPYSSFYSGDADQPGYYVAEDGMHGVLEGTSMATPHAAGTVALMLEANPTLTLGEIRNILRTTARGQIGYSPRAGFGRLDALGAVKVARGEKGGTVSALTSTVGVNHDVLPPSEERFVVTVTARDANGLPLAGAHDVAITATAGLPLEEVAAVGAGRYERTFLAKAHRGDVATVTARVDGTTLAQAPQVFFVEDRAEVGRPFAAAGGCSIAEPEGFDYGAAPMVLVRLFLFIALLVGVSACGHNIGDACKTNVDCDPLGSRFCDTSSPRGYCTVEGCEVDTCPKESACIRFFTPVQSEPCTYTPDDPNGRSDCRVDERCVCDETVDGECVGEAHCSPETSERRWCMLKCDSNHDCRKDYECRATGTLGALPVGTLDDPVGKPAKFCVPRAVAEQ